MNGVVAVKPDLPPNVTGFAAFDVNGNQIDTNRLNGDPISPFLVNAGSALTIGFVATDTSDGTSATDPGQFTVKEIHFSTDKNDFSNSTVLVASTYIAGYSAWLATLPAVSWPVGTTVYFRIYVNDGHHTNNTEFPGSIRLIIIKLISLFMYSKGILLWAALFLCFSCNKDKIEFDSTPSIEVTAISPGSVQEFTEPVTITIKYKDGDGDLGENSSGVKTVLLLTTGLELFLLFVFSNSDQRAPTFQSLDL